MRNNGFTLAEVLITLGIIGVIAAMTLPGIVQNYQGKILREQLTKQYSIITNVMQKMNYDLGTLKVNDFGYHNFGNKFKEYINQIKDCKNADCEDMGITDENSTRISKNYKTYSNKKLQNTLLDDGQTIATDGAFYLIENFGSNNNYFIYITVDVNGFYKKPNRWGHDLFTFQIFDEGKVLPMGHDDTVYHNKSSYCSNLSSNMINGIGCTYYALTDKKYFKNLPKF